MSLFSLKYQNDIYAQTKIEINKKNVFVMTNKYNLYNEYICM